MSGTFFSTLISFFMLLIDTRVQKMCNNIPSLSWANV